MTQNEDAWFITLSACKILLTTHKEKSSWAKIQIKHCLSVSVITFLLSDLFFTSSNLQDEYLN